MSRTAKLTLLLALAGPACLAQVGPVAAPNTRASQPSLGNLDYGLQPRQIAEGTWVIEGAVDDFLPANGCNIINTAFIVTAEGVVVINTGPSRLYGEQQRQAIERVTRQPVREVFNLNLHPDYFFGNQAWADSPVSALPGTMAGMRAEGAAYADNLYRLCGDWMKGTEPRPATHEARERRWRLGAHELELRRLQGHTGDDLVLIDHRTGVLFAGGLVFADRAPTTPHADFSRWDAALQTLQQWHAQGQFRTVVPSHGPVHEGLRGVNQTLAWLRWADRWMQQRAQAGADLNEVLHEPLPPEYRDWAAQPAEWHRTLTQMYPARERKVLQR